MAGVRAGNDALAIGAQLSALGTVLLPGEPLASGIRRAVSQAGTSGGRLLVPPGVWDVGADGITIEMAGLEIVALSPGRTIFRRVLGRDAATLGTFSSYIIKYGVLTISGGNVIVRGITFSDTTGTGPAIVVTGGGVSVIDCVFASCGRAVVGYEAERLRVEGNTFTYVRAAESVLTIGTMRDAIISGNRGDGNIVLDSGTTHSTVTGNVLDSGGTITFVGGTAANFAVGNNAPVNEEGAYSLIDNTAVAADVTNFPTWDVTIYRSVHMRYQISRGATPDIETGELVVVMNSAECIAYVDAVTTTTAPGVTLSGTVSGGTAKLQYTTTATGSSATLLIFSVTYGGA